MGEWLWQAEYKIRLFEATIDDGTNMISHCANGSISGVGKLGGGCCCSKERSCGQRTLNLAFFSVRKRRTAGGMRLVSTDIVVVILVSLLVLLAMTNIVLQSYQLLLYISYANI